MRVEARPAAPGDVDTLARLYRELEKEMIALHSMWPLADGLDEPVESSLAELVDDQAALVVIGEIEGYPMGFLVARVEELLDQADGEQVGAVRLVFVDHAAREVSVGETMLNLALHELRGIGITKFDAHVLPGHRLAKNFFESAGFSARSIVMHHDDARG